MDPITQILSVLDDLIPGESPFTPDQQVLVDRARREGTFGPLLRNEGDIREALLGLLDREEIRRRFEGDHDRLVGLVRGLGPRSDSGPARLLREDKAAVRVLPETVQLRGDLPSEQDVGFPKVSVVVPVYRELANGHFFRLIESFTNQTASTEDYELVIIVNNTPEVAELAGEVYQENQRTLELARYLEGLVVKRLRFVTALPDWQQRIIDVAKENRLRIRTIDLSTKGIERNIGKIRDAGVQKILAECTELCEDRIIAMFDADVTVPRHYVEGILSHFKNPELDTLFLSIDFRMGEGAPDESFYQTSLEFRYNLVWQNNFIGALFPRRDGSIYADSPLIVTRASIYSRVGGVPHQSTGEDLELSQRLSRKSRFKFAHDIEVISAERAREDGFNAAERLWGGSKAKGMHRRLQFVLRPCPTMDMLGVVLGRLYRECPHDVSDDLLNKIFEFFGYQYNSQQWRAFQVRMEKEWWRADWMEYLGSIWPKIFEKEILGSSKDPASYDDDMLRFLLRVLPPREREYLQDQISGMEKAHNQMVAELLAIARRVRVNVGQLRDPLYGIEDGRAHEFFRSNPWIIKYIERNWERLSIDDDVLAFLKEQFPDWFNPFDRTDLKRTVDRMMVMSRFIKEARNQPEEFPSTHRILKLIDGDISAKEYFEDRKSGPDIRGRLAHLTWGEYSRLTEAQKGGLRAEFHEAFKPADPRTTQARYRVYPLARDEDMEVLVRASRELAAKEEYLGGRIFSLGRSPQWFVTAASLVDDDPQRFGYIPFSGGWYRALGNLRRISQAEPDRRQIDAYRAYLATLGLNPRQIAEEKGPTVIVETPSTGAGLYSFAEILINWAEELGVKKGLAEKLIFHLLISNGTEYSDYRNGWNPVQMALKEAGFKVELQVVPGDLAEVLGSSLLLFNDRFVPRLELAKTDPERIPNPVFNSESAGLVRFRIMDYLARTEQRKPSGPGDREVERRGEGVGVEHEGPIDTAQGKRRTMDEGRGGVVVTTPVGTDDSKATKASVEGQASGEAMVRGAFWTVSDGNAVLAQTSPSHNSFPTLPRPADDPSRQGRGKVLSGGLTWYEQQRREIVLKHFGKEALDWAVVLYRSHGLTVDELAQEGRQLLARDENLQAKLGISQTSPTDLDQLSQVQLGVGIWSRIPEADRQSVEVFVLGRRGRRSKGHDVSRMMRRSVVARGNMMRGRALRMVTRH